MTALARNLFAALLLGLALSTSAQASTLRCGTQLINEGDKMDAVLEKCGAPAKREVFPPAPPRRGPDGKFIPGGATIEIWTYPPQNGATRVLRFREGILMLIGTEFR
ncbi:DUF2845 domain-containing protein [Pseudomonas citronellolis]|uniref:DUF2845 domain-containing protein n=1 Tax=Pseudomonas citronellolis TaxID=53408 RepID=UPI000718A883|nr:DUF2845 domain-containing protein [Pseudomonas citronellolis]KRV79661.1 hypothetical protein AO742_28660 [Pseudomonas citronellolis]KRW77907.1 hypothetical protein AO738_04680 [Pseudomonas citronellolis]